MKHGDVWKNQHGTIELRCGDWREVLADVETCDAVICDPPYSERTHKGHDTKQRDNSNRRSINYENYTEENVKELITLWTKRCRGWWVVLMDHTLFPAYEDAFHKAGLYSFAPLPCVIPGMGVRLTGDGPSCWSVYALVARPRIGEFLSWGTLPGAYNATRDRNTIVVGAKPLSLMRAIVRDYSRPDDLIVDPCAGGGTTLLAAAMEGRRSIGAEIDPDTFEKAVNRLSGGYTLTLGI